MNHRNSIIFFFLVCLLLMGISLPSCHRRITPQPVETHRDTIYPLGFCTDSFDLVEGTLRSGEIFTGLMQRLGLDARQAQELAMASDSVFDMRKLRAGNRWQAYYEADTNAVGDIRYLVYEQDKVHLTVFQCKEPFAAWKVEKPVATVRKAADVTIRTSLWNDMVAADVSPQLIVQLSEIYAWTVDFFTLQPGDRFRVLYDEDHCEGEVIGIHAVDYAIFSRDTTEIPAVRFHNAEGVDQYWRETGESLKKAFLKAPLKYTRISSGFSYHRKHPVYGYTRAHTAVDYAAPTGTPVMAIGDGTVISKGWGGGGGNTVKIRHNSVYTTAYLHLSRYAAGLKVGDHVRQGDVIGYVGMTGTATGPHLDFRVWKNGTPVNPLTLESPDADPIAADSLPALDSVARLYRTWLDSLSTVPDSIRLENPAVR